ncbi:MAG TPA: PilZ domain-containing protein [Pyrinomonadaceae bacterium]|nr:PilZ domain-containing protein [Pyrinomonadaceae bacterium]
MAGLHELLCNNCGLEFKGFDPLRRLNRAPAKNSQKRVTDRRFPRYKVHVPATISLVERNPLTWEVAYSPAALGRCEVISQGGMSLEFVGSRFREDQLKVGCSLYVTINLGPSVIAAVVSVITCERVKSNKQVKWLVGAAITQTSDADSTKLAAYLEKHSKIELVAALA